MSPVPSPASTPPYIIREGDTRALLPTVPAASVDFVFADPIYPCVDRKYGRLTVLEWKLLMADVVRETRRVLKPTGSAVFVIQPNAAKVGSMRPWAFQFMAWIAKDWNLIQDVWWWNHTAMPTVHATRVNGLMRPSVKACVWAGAPDCFRDQSKVLWEPSQASIAQRKGDAARMVYSPSGHHKNVARINGVGEDRGGVTPFNLLPVANTDSTRSSGASGHGAGTPYALAHWWIRYACPPGGKVLDPFCGAGTSGEAAASLGCAYEGFDKDPEYAALARRFDPAASP